MNSFSNINMITVLIAGIFLIPILAGILHPFSNNRIQHSLVSMLNSLEFLLGIILAIYLARVIFSGNGNSFLTSLYKFIPSIKDLLPRQDIWAYIITVLVLLLVIICVLRLLTTPLHRYAIVPLSNRISSAVNSMNCVVKRIIGGIWQLPRSVFLVFVFSLLLNFYTSFNNNPSMGEYINNSAAYQLIYKNVLHPLLSSNIEKNNKNKAYLLYKWISKSIKYDYDKAKIIAANPSGVASGSIVAYTTRKGVCFDYSCLYVSM